MAATKAPQLKTLENFYSVPEAAVRLGLRKPEDTGKGGEKWLRDGVNLHGFPCHRLAGQLKFSDTDLAEIAERHRNKPETRSRRRPARRRPVTRPSAAAA
ncbi:hypothetical protein [Streptomyces sp. NPDC086989]|uniref:hypothetical protein n=1 Tax=Streptomyces sp. NPDC086989 TaxID=3365764 RepID=UPI003817F9C0